MIYNNGGNVHICFACAGEGSYTHHHLCNEHADGRNIIGVNWEVENFFVTGSEGINQEAEDEGTNQQTFDIEPPGYEEAAQYPTVSTWDEKLMNKPHQLIRQYSLGLKRMVSTSESETLEVPEAQNMLSYPRQPPGNPDMSS